MDSSRVLIVEDENIVALDIRRNVRKAGYETVDIVSSGEEALARFEELNPDLVLMDIHLQGAMDGLQAARAVRKKYGVPVILLTAYADDSTIERAIVTEPFGYIIKPFEQKELKISIEMALYRHRLEQQLQYSEERFRRLFEDDLSGDFIAGEDGTILMCNEAFLEIFGKRQGNPGKIVNINHLFLSEEDKNYFWERIYSEKKLRLFETELKTCDGRVVTVLANVIGSFDDSEKLKEVKGYIIDTTERKDLETKLQQAQKLEAIGRLAGGLAHDFNNILTVIMGYTSIMKDKNEAKESVEGEINGIKKITQKASILTRQLLAFSRNQVLKPEKIDLNLLIRDLEKMLKRLITDDIRMSISTGADRSIVYIDPSKMELVLMNLVVNARDAMQGGGTLSIQTKNMFLDTGTLPLGECNEPGLYAELIIKDTGTGIPEENLDKIFEPFFTTKPESKGTGLGLSSVYGIVRQSGGYIRVESVLGKGTSFFLYFPVTEALDTEEREEKGSDAPGYGSERILVVEDEELLRGAVHTILSKRGYKVIEVSNAGEALLLVEEQHVAFDLLLTDLIMPHINGDRLAARLKKSLPTFRTLVMSGYPPSMLQEKGINVNGLDFISKPFDPDDLARKIRSILDS
ncbi:MAG: response regulator [Spirochaetales bacterium]|nr:response regulator [Spirochaetales bacterium]